ncbi:23S rRNA pseudouridine(955/2504/2580) synthase [Corynebacterium xerosis]|uniref:Pseudouridine synthase n=1 Tax=Corynebacterium xerosis TaxID=1725 RepID=A0A2N6SXE4_9CORY|nr:23S rRNA pseudouridine(955/2504/2580) synthase [Corynebacterium xerosis]
MFLVRVIFSVSGEVVSTIGGNSGRRRPGPGSTTFAARTVTVPATHDGRRLDKYLRSQLKGVPATLLFRLMREGRIRVNGSKVKQNHRIAGGDELTLPTITVEAGPSPRPVARHLVDAVKNAIVHEDERLIVVDKPANLAVHRGTGVDAGVIEALRRARPDVPDLELAHRLDRETSGLLMVAKTPAMLRHLQEILRDREHEIDRRYLALVEGAWPDDLRVSHAPLQRTSRATIAAPGSRGGQRSETHFRVVERHGGRATVIEARLLTGRKHQIRVHCREAGHPIAGDSRYGSPGFNRHVRGRGITTMMLHAHSLEVPLPDGGVLHLTAPPPKEWEQF